MLAEQRDVRAPLAQRRDVDADHVETEVEVLAEASIGDGLGQARVGRRQDPRIDADRPPRAEPAVLAVLEHVQELRLEVRAHLADLVEQDRALMGQLELAGFVAQGAGERAALVAEQLRFEKLLGEGRAVHLHERPLLPPGLRVDEAREHLLAHAGFARDQHRRVGVRDLARHLADVQHGAAGGDRLVRGPRGQAPPEGPDLVLQQLLLEGVPYRQLELLLPERLGQVIGGAALHRVHHRLQPSHGGEYDHRQRGLRLADAVENLQAADARQDQVEEHELRPRRILQAAQRLLAGLGAVHLVSERREERGQEPANALVVVHDQDAALRHTSLRCGRPE